MTNHAANLTAAAVIGGLLVVGYFWAAKERAKEQEQEQERSLDRESLYDVIARRMAHNLDTEWQRLATLACRDWPTMPDDAADLPRTW